MQIFHSYTFAFATESQNCVTHVGLNKENKFPYACYLFTRLLAR